MTDRGARERRAEGARHGLAVLLLLGFDVPAGVANEGERDDHPGPRHRRGADPDERARRDRCRQRPGTERGRGDA